jgi:hypothetical protein
VRVRAKREAEFSYKFVVARSDRTLTPTPLPTGEGLKKRSPAWCRASSFMLGESGNDRHTDDFHSLIGSFAA